MQIVMLCGHSAILHLPCREWLATARSAQLVSHFAQQSDTGLRQAVMQLDVMRQMGQAYVQTDTGSQGTNIFRGVRLGTVPCPVAGAPCCRMQAGRAEFATVMCVLALSRWYLTSSRSRRV